METMPTSKNINDMTALGSGSKMICWYVKERKNISPNSEKYQIP